MERKLAAILSADVKGYSRLMGDDEVATVRTLTAYREVMTDLIRAHRGRVVDSPGDNMLAEFVSVVDAVQCAIAIQKELSVRNAELPTHRQMAFRIGINVGDVLTEDGRLYGDGVNIAARLEGLADAGGICLSETAYAQVKNKLALRYEDIGEQQVKNIAEPVRAYKVQPELDSVAAPAVSQEHPVRRPAEGKRTSRPWRRATLLVMVLLGVGIGVTVLRNFFLPPSFLPARSPTKAVPALPLPDKPSIAVLPFVNMSGDPEQEYFSDGITETLITDLSTISSLFVIARNSVFIYKGQAMKRDQVSRELGVRYVVEGSVQKVQGRVRINVQLIDATTGGHLWAERYDRDLADIFTLQDEVIQKIVTALAVRLTAGEEVRLTRFPTSNLDAYDHFLRGVEYYFRFRKEANIQARQMFTRAIELDPQYAAAYAMLSWTYWTDWYSQWDPVSRPLERAFEAAQQAATIDDSLSQAHMILGIVYLWQRQHEQALTEAERAITVNPNEADAYWTLGLILNFAERPEAAMKAVETAMRLNPWYPPYYSFDLGRAYRLLGQHEKAIIALKDALARNPNFLPARLQLAGVYSESDRKEEARAEVAEILRLSPDFSLEVHRQSSPYKDPAALERYIDSLRRAGLK